MRFLLFLLRVHHSVLRSEILVQPVGVQDVKEHNFGSCLFRALCACLQKTPPVTEHTDKTVKMILRMLAKLFSVLSEDIFWVPPVINPDVAQILCIDLETIVVEGFVSPLCVNKVSLGYYRSNNGARGDTVSDERSKCRGPHHPEVYDPNFGPFTVTQKSLYVNRIHPQNNPNTCHHHVSHLCLMKPVLVYSRRDPSALKSTSLTNLGLKPPFAFTSSCGTRTSA